MSTLKIRAVRVLRKVASVDPRLEHLVYRAYTRPKVEKGAGYIQLTGRNYVVVSSRNDPDSSRIGIYLRGGCDLPAMFSMAPLLRKRAQGSYAIFRDPNEIAGSRSDFLMQSLEEHSEDTKKAMSEVVSRLELKRTYFDDQLFRPSFPIPPLTGDEWYPRSVVVLSVGPDFTRVLYRHRRYGFLADPGGFWLQGDMSQAISDTSRVEWFRSEFESVGRMTVEDFKVSFGRLVDEVKARTGAHVLVFNMLSVDPNERLHSYRLVKSQDTARRRDFNIALAEISRAHEFDIVDVDRVAKGRGVTEQVDFAHFSDSQFPDIASEALRILEERAVL